MIKDMTQHKYDRNNNNSRIPRNKNNENETNIHTKPKQTINTAYHISKTKKESRDNRGSTDEKETNKINEKGTNRQDERKATPSCNVGHHHFLVLM